MLILMRKSEKQIEADKQTHEKDSKGKNVEVEEIYLCFCQKQYMSFSAFYLHLKQKHLIFIQKSDIGLLKRTVEWSGSKKRIYYEIQEEKEYHQIEESECRNSEQTRQASYKNCHLKTYLLLKDLPKLLRLFLEDLNSLKISNRHHEIHLIHTLYSFFMETEASDNNNMSFQSRISSLPMYFNDFIIEKFWKEEERYLDEERSIKLLLQLSEWLYRKKLSPYLAVKNSSQ